MTSPTTLQSQRLPKPSRSPKQIGGDDQAGKKPKKVNSEIRKQQNRIASKNYREKRKRKLQYLQQLIKDESSDQQSSDLSSEQHEAYTRSLSVDYESSGRSSSPYILPSNSDFRSMSSSCETPPEPILTANGQAHHLATSQPYPAFVTSWNAPVYSPPPPAPLSTWDIPIRMPNTGFQPNTAPPHHEVLQYTTPSGPPVFAQSHPPSQQPCEFLSDADYYALGSALRFQNQTPGLPIVSVPTSSPYYQEVFPRPH